MIRQSVFPRLRQNATVTLLQHERKIYYKIPGFYYKIRQLLQNAIVIIKYEGLIVITSSSILAVYNDKLMVIK